MDEKTVLVIEDDELNMKLVREILLLGPYKPIEAPDAETGISFARKYRPDLILMDVHLPKMDGLSATRLILDDEDLREIPVVALTALAMPEDRQKALEAGCVAHVTKPFEVMALLDLIGDLLKSKTDK